MITTKVLVLAVGILELNFPWRSWNVRRHCLTFYPILFFFLSAVCILGPTGHKGHQLQSVKSYLPYLTVDFWVDPTLSQPAHFSFQCPLLWRYRSSESFSSSLKIQATYRNWFERWELRRVQISQKWEKRLMDVSNRIYIMLLHAQTRVCIYVHRRIKCIIIVYKNTYTKARALEHLSKLYYW